MIVKKELWSETWKQIVTISIWNVRVIMCLPHSQSKYVSKEVKGQYSQSGWQGQGMSAGPVHCRSLNTNSWHEHRHTTHNHTSGQQYGSGCNQSGSQSSCTESLRAEQTHKSKHQSRFLEKRLAKTLSEDNGPMLRAKKLQENNYNQISYNLM